VRVQDIPELARLSMAEKILLVEDLWDSIAGDAASVPVPESHRDELKRRLRALEANPGALLSLEDLEARISRRK